MKKRNGFVTFIVVVLVCVLAGIGFFKLVDCVIVKENTDGARKLLSRSARSTDVSVSTSSEFSLSVAYDLVPNSDIDNLQLTIIFSNSSKEEVKRKTKDIGNVKEGQKYNFNFSITEFSITDPFVISYWRYEVTGGTVSYFA